MSNSNKRRKRDCTVLSRRELYEKYVPHISQDFAKIVDKSKNIEFKQRCKLLLKVDDPSKIQEAINSKLFRLTLGDHYEVNTSQNAKARAEQKTDQDIQSCFGDLADHVDDGEWSDYTNESFPAEKLSRKSKHHAPGSAEIGTHGNCSNVAASDDENFNSLELHAMYDERSWNDTTACYSEDQTVPCGDVHSSARKYQPMSHQLDDTSREDITYYPYSNPIPINVKNTIQIISKHDQPVLQQSSTMRQHGAIADRVVKSFGETQNTMQKMPQPVSHWSNINRTRSVLSDGNGLSCGNLPSTSTFVPIPICNQPVPQRPGTNTVDRTCVESDDSHFETLGNLF